MIRTLVAIVTLLPATAARSEDFKHLESHERVAATIAYARNTGHFVLVPYDGDEALFVRFPNIDDHGRVALDCPLAPGKICHGVFDLSVYAKHGDVLVNVDEIHILEVPQ